MPGRGGRGLRSPSTTRGGGRESSVLRGEGGVDPSREGQTHRERKESSAGEKRSEYSPRLFKKLLGAALFADPEKETRTSRRRAYSVEA